MSVVVLPAGGGETCKICGDGAATAKSSLNDIDFQGSKLSVMMHFVQCDVCGSEYADKREMDLNAEEFRKFRISR